MKKKKIIVIGWTLLGVLLISILAIAILGIMEGDGARPWRLVRGGRGGTVFPLALLPVFLAAIALGFFWAKRHFSGRKNQQQQKTNPNKQED